MHGTTVDEVMQHDDHKLRADAGHWFRWDYLSNRRASIITYVCAAQISAFSSDKGPGRNPDVVLCPWKSQKVNKMTAARTP